MNCALNFVGYLVEPKVSFVSLIGVAVVGILSQHGAIGPLGAIIVGVGSVWVSNALHAYIKQVAA